MHMMLLFRNWVILDHGNRPITQRSHPMLARVKVTLDHSQLTLSGKDKEDISVPLAPADGSNMEKTAINIFSVIGEGVHVSDEADRWLSEFLNKDGGYRLFQFISCCKPRVVSADKKFGVFAKPQDKVAFPDLCPFLMISTASLGQLNNHLEHKVQMTRFRPNIVISGCQPFEEDEWRYVKIGDVDFRCLHRCGRCTLPTVDPETGIKDINNEPLKTLRKIRLVPKEDDPRFGDSPVFGRNLSCDREGVISVGDIVYASV